MPKGEFDERQQLETSECVSRCCGSGRETLSRKLWGLCQEGKPLFHHCIHRSHEWTGIEHEPLQTFEEGSCAGFLIQTAIWHKTDIGCDVLSVRLSSVFFDPAWCPLKGSSVVILRGGVYEGCPLRGNMALGESLSASHGSLWSWHQLKGWLRADCVYLFYVYLKLLYHWLLERKCLIAVGREECKL